MVIADPNTMASQEAGYRPEVPRTPAAKPSHRYKRADYAIRTRSVIAHLKRVEPVLPEVGDYIKKTTAQPSLIAEAWNTHRPADWPVGLVKIRDLDWQRTCAYLTFETQSHLRRFVLARSLS